MEPTPDASPDEPPRRPPGRPPGTRVPSAPQPPDPRPLLVQLEERFQKLRANNSLIRRLEGEIERQGAKIREAYQLMKVARTAKRQHEVWLKEEAAAQLKKKLGIQTIVGFASRRQGAAVGRAELHEKMAEAAAKAKEQLK